MTEVRSQRSEVRRQRPQRKRLPEERDQEWYFKELQSEGCLCGRTKKPKHSFCHDCYYSLPTGMRRRLYRRLGFGYEAAFEEAAAWLEENVWWKLA